MCFVLHNFNSSKLLSNHDLVELKITFDLLYNCSLFLSWTRMTVLSAKHIISASVLILSKPLIYRIKNNGPKTIPCGTPCFTDNN